MKSIILTFDKNRIFTEHLIGKYRELWPDHPFTFLIPYQTLRGIETKDIKYVKSPSEIRQTVLSLLEGIDDEEWIFWSLDDWYPIYLDTEKLNQIARAVNNGNFKDWSGVNFCVSHKEGRKRIKRLLKTSNGRKNIDGFNGIEIENYDQIWLNQFIKCKVLRHLFESMPDPKNGAKDMDELKKQVQKPKDHKLFQLSNDYAIFGESTSHGKVTVNCHKSILSMGLNIDQERLDKGLVNARIIGRPKMTNPILQMKFYLERVINKLSRN